MAYYNAIVTLLQSMSGALINEIKFRYDLEDKVRSLQNEVEIMFTSITNSEGKTEKEVEKITWNQIRDIAYVAEDVIDTFITKVSKHKRRSKVMRMLHYAQYIKLLHVVSYRIDAIKNTIKEIHDNKLKYDVPESSNNNDPKSTEEEDRVRLQHQRRRIVEEKNVVGLDHHSEVIINKLTEGLGRRVVVSIIGMGGLGKTTLARKVYKNNRVQMHFNCKAWLYLPKDCKAKELLLELLKQLMSNAEFESTKTSKKEKDMTEIFSRLREDELKEKVKECLKWKRYLVVLDDLWVNQVWDEVEDAFPDNNQGSRILITSRLKGVALHTSQDSPYQLGFLTEEQGWELFSSKVDCPSDLEPLGKEIVEGCRGLPLSIVVIAGLLAHKNKSHKEWSKVANHVNWYITVDETQVKDIVLKLSFDNLPLRLKPCFLYLGMYPAIGIFVRHLLEQWVVEGFIQETRGRDPIDVAEEYLYELIDRSLIQVGSVKASGCVRTCHVHDLLRDLCIYESKEQKFFEVCMNSNIMIPTKPRRLAIHGDMSQYASLSSNDHSCVRSLLVFDFRHNVDHSEWIRLSKDFKLVRVLYLSAVHCCTKIPLGDFIHLRYLRLRSKEIGSIPDSICNLQNLETLIVDPRSTGMFHPKSSPISLPGDIWKLKRLRNLHVYGMKYIILREHHSKSSKVTWNVQTMGLIELNQQGVSFFEKGIFPQLRELGLIICADSKVNKVSISKVLLSLQNMDSLNELKISFYFPPNEECRFHPDLQQSLELLFHLRVRVLKIDPCFNLPIGPTLLPLSITKLVLKKLGVLNDVVMSVLGNLPKLEHLTLCNYSFIKPAFVLNCISGFPQLQVLHLRWLGATDWKLSSDAMPRLQRVKIVCCCDLVSLPEELWSLATLREVSVEDLNEEFMLMLKNLELKNFSITLEYPGSESELSEALICRRS